MENSKQEPVVYNPSSLMHIFNNALSNEALRKTFIIQGRYIPGKGVAYNGYYYDLLKDAYSDASLSFVVPSLLRNKLQPDQTIECHAYLTKRLQANAGRIDLQLNLVDIVSQQQTAITEDEIRSLEILQEKLRKGVRDVDVFIKNKIISDEKIRVVIILGKTGIIDADIKHQLKEAISFFEFSFVRVSLTTEADILEALAGYDDGSADIICISRGGGEQIAFFDRIAIAEAAVGLNSLLVTAIGHKQDITLLQKVADKSFITPTALGQYFHDIYTHTIEELQHSKAKLIEQVSLQFKANYEKQINNLNERLTASQQLFEKFKEENRLLHAKELEMAQRQLDIFKRRHQEEMESLSKLSEEKERFAKRQIEEIRLQKTPPGNQYAWIAVAALIIALLVYLRACGQ